MILVSGASGRLGRSVLRLLLERVDPARVVALSRTPEAVADLGVMTRTADFDNPRGLVTAFDGAERLLLISTNVFGPTGRRVTQHHNAVQAAVKAGVEHLVYTSIARAGDPAHPAAVAADHRATELALADSGLTYTVLRNSIYADLILLGAPVAVVTGSLLDNCGGGGISYVTREDCAAVAAEVLVNGGHEGQALEVTGPQAVTQYDIADLLTQLSGLPVRYRQMSDEEIVTDLVDHGMPEESARLFATNGRAVREGFTGLVSDVVERLTGRPATTVAAFLTAHRDELLAL